MQGILANILFCYISIFSLLGKRRLRSTKLSQEALFALKLQEALFARPRQLCWLIYCVEIKWLITNPQQKKRKRTDIEEMVSKSQKRRQREKQLLITYLRANRFNTYMFTHCNFLLITAFQFFPFRFILSRQATHFATAVFKITFN